MFAIIVQVYGSFFRLKKANGMAKNGIMSQLLDLCSMNLKLSMLEFEKIFKMLWQDVLDYELSIYIVMPIVLLMLSLMKKCV